MSLFVRVFVHQVQEYSNHFHHFGSASRPVLFLSLSALYSTFVLMPSSVLFENRWHGFNPCYLLTFVLGGFAQSLGRLLRNHVRPFFLPPGSTTTTKTSPPSRATPAPVPSVKIDPSSSSSSAPTTTTTTAVVKVRAPPQTRVKTLYDVVGIASTQLVLNFAVTPFLLLDVSRTVQAWRSVGFYGLLMVFVPTVLFNLGLKGVLKTRIKRRDQLAVRTKDEDEVERKRLEWERFEEEKRLRRGEGVPGIGMDIETMMDEERKLAEKSQQLKDE